MSDPGSRCWAVVPAAGIGSRMAAECPKQYCQLAGSTVLEHSLEALLASERVSGVVLALHVDDQWAGQLEVIADPRVHTTIGGAERRDSVLAALASLQSLAGDRDWVLVHDAARPCLTRQQLDNLIDTVLATDVGGLLGERIVDTVKLTDGTTRIERTLDRERLWRAQTPQMFRIGELRTALFDAQGGGLLVTDEASAMEAAGYPVQLVEGSSRNLKVTVPADLELAAWYLERGLDGE